MIADETWTNRKAHRLVLALSGTEVGDADVCHTCDNPACCNPAHLFLGTHLDNMRDRQRKGRTVVPLPRLGESNPRARLTEHDVDEVRWAYAANRPIRDIAADFGVSRGTVRLIVRRETWRSVP